MSQDRYYTAGTKEALFMLSRGFCYEPSCKERVMRWTGSEWRPKVAVAHIRGLHNYSARYDAAMTDRERNNFKNLILLCKIHHDLVDGKQTAHDFSVITLTDWKKEREGDLADELDLLDWITQEKLQELMSDAIEETLDKILGAIDNISNISKETLDMLKSLVAETLKLPYLAPEDIASLAYSAGVFETLQNYIPVLHESAQNISIIPRYSEILDESTRPIKNLPDSADTLYHASRVLANLEDNAPMLYEAALIIRDSPLRNLSSVTDDIEYAIDKLQRTVSSLVRPAVSIGERYESHQPSLVSASADTVRPWKFFWWGFIACAVFVITVLSLWVYATTHK